MAAFVASSAYHGKFDMVSLQLAVHVTLLNLSLSFAIMVCCTDSW